LNMLFSTQFHLAYIQIMSNLISQAGQTRLGGIANDTIVWVQMPVWFILAIAEILGYATISEIAYEQALKGMKSVVQAVTQLTVGLAAVLGIALSPITKDPTLVVLYSVIAGLTVVAAFPFWLDFRTLDVGP
ncbi:oligopeptide transporter, partial [Colletotrichum incanum]